MVVKNVAVARLNGAARPAPPPVDLRLQALEAELARVTAALEAADGMAAAAARDAERHVDAAHRRGIEQGRAEAADAETERLAMLREALGRAEQAWNERLEDLESLAATLARTALGRILGQTDLDLLVAATVQRHMAALRSAGATTIFAHPSLVPTIVEPGLAVEADASLGKGECRVALGLGGAELSIEQQWRRIDALLATLEVPR